MSALTALVAVGAMVGAGVAQAADGPRWGDRAEVEREVRGGPAPDVRALADTEAVLADAAGDYDIEDPSVSTIPPPDVLELKARFVDNATGRVDDDEIEISTLVDNNPNPNAFSESLFTVQCIAANLVCSDALVFNIDTAPGAGNANGADHRVFVIGTPDGIPVTAVLLSWDPGTGSFVNPRNLRLDKAGTRWVWRANATGLGVVRGRPIGVEILSRHDICLDDFSDCQLTGSDFAPDVDPFLVLQIPGNPPPPSFGATAVSGVSPSGAQVSVPVNPLGSGTLVHVRYGVGSVNESRTPEIGVGDGVSATTVTIPVGGLRFSTDYQFQVVARNAWGEVATPVQTFRTAPEAATAFQVGTQGAGVIGLRSARISGTITTLGAPGSYYFQYGTRTLSLRTPRVSFPAGTPSGARTANLRNLAPGTTYRYRFVAEIDGKTIVGGTRTFRTRQRDRLIVSSNPQIDCFLRSGYCTPSSIFTVVVRLRDGGSGRTVSAPTRGIRVNVRCVRGCRVNARVPLVGRSQPSANAARYFRGVRLRAGSIIEVRATRPDSIGAVFRMRLDSGLNKRLQVCELTPSGRQANCRMP